MFHVKHGSPWREQAVFHVKQPDHEEKQEILLEVLLPHTELPENHIQDILDIDTAQ